jgi:hypothetical protein
MSVQVKRRRDTAANLVAFTGAQGELLVDTTNNRLQVHDGATAGGWPAALETRTSVSDAAYSALVTDRLVAYTALTAARVVTLPAAASYPSGARLTIVDESGACSSTKTITVTRAGSDTIDGATSTTLNGAYQAVALESNGSNAWAIVVSCPNDEFALLGVGTAPDPNNPLSVSGASALFSGATNFNVTVNKGGSGGAASDTASFIFEDGYSGRAQIGLCGDDNFHFKVSGNGSTWYDALDIVDSSGLVEVNYGMTVTSGDVMLGANTPTAPLTITTQTATLPTPQSGTAIHLIGANGASNAAVWNAYANNGSFTFIRADGSLGSEQAVGANEGLGGFTVKGYDGSAYSGNSGVITAKTVGAWTSSNHGTNWLFYTTPQNSTANSQALGVYAGVVIGSGATDPGAGNLNVGGQLQVGGATAIGSDRSYYLRSYTVSTLPAAGNAGRMAFASNCRMFNGAGTQEGAGAGTGGLVVDNGTAWKIAGTNVTAIA